MNRSTTNIKAGVRDQLAIYFTFGFIAFIELAAWTILAIKIFTE